MDLGEIEWDSWIGLFYHRIGTGGGGLFEAVMKFRVS